MKKRRELLKNKICAVSFIGVSVLTVPIEHDATALIFACVVGIPLFFAKENWIL